MANVFDWIDISVMTTIGILGVVGFWKMVTRPQLFYSARDALGKDTVRDMK